MPQRRRVRRKRPIRRRTMMPLVPPPISVNPWRKVTLSVEQEGEKGDVCVKSADVTKALKEQLGITLPKLEFRLHRVRCWNRGRAAYSTQGSKGYDIEVPATNGPLALSACDLVANRTSTCGNVTFLKTVESYPGKNTWARATYTWNAQNSRLILGQPDDAVLFTWKAPNKESVLFHIIVSFRAVATGTFTEATLRVTNPIVETDLASTVSAAAIKALKDMEIQSP